MGGQPWPAPLAPPRSTPVNSPAAPESGLRARGSGGCSTEPSGGAGCCTCASSCARTPAPWNMSSTCPSMLSTCSMKLSQLSVTCACSARVQHELHRLQHAAARCVTRPPRRPGPVFRTVRGERAPPAPAAGVLARPWAGRVRGAPPARHGGSRPAGCRQRARNRPREAAGDACGAPACCGRRLRRQRGGATARAAAGHA